MAIEIGRRDIGVLDPQVERVWEHNGHVCAVTLYRTTLCRCGYVFVDDGSILNGVSYMDDRVGDIIVHGGLTFSGELSLGIVNDNAWAFGFDCAHYLDAPDIEAGIERYGDDQHYHSGFFDRRRWTPDDDSQHIWTLEETMDETQQLCDQIARLEVI